MKFRSSSAIVVAAALLLTQAGASRAAESDPSLIREQMTVIVDGKPEADYDHDGQATEFLLQVDTLPCGKHQMVLVGISKANPHTMSSLRRKLLISR